MENILQFIFFANMIFHLSESQNNRVQYYEYIINKQIDESNNYTFPKDASMYYSSEEEIHDYGTFDFVIIGAGSTGSVITNRLSEIKKWNILLLEAGKFGNDVIGMPGLTTLAQFTNYNWGYLSTPQKTACWGMIDQKCLLPSGRGIGGSTLINELVYARANKKDFDRWAQEGNPGWSYGEIFKYFKKSENFNKNIPNVLVDEEYHGSGGEMNVEYAIPGHPLSWLWLEANKEKGYRIVDYNGQNQSGAAYMQLNIKEGKRADAGTSFIEPIKNRRNLKISTSSYVTKIIIDKRRAIGVQFTKNGKTYVVRAKKEVILSAGAYGSPKILMLSGIGPKKHLREVGIDPIIDLPVGSSIKDHTLFEGLYFTSNYTEVVEPLEKYIKQFLNGTGAMTSFYYIGALGFHQTKYGLPNYPDLEVIMIPNSGFETLLQEKLSHAKQKTSSISTSTGSFFMTVLLLNVSSVGSLKLRSKNPFDYPLIDVNFLTDDHHHDIDTLYEGIQLAINITNTQAFARVNASLIKQDVPACDDKVYLSEEYWKCVMPYFTLSGFHPVGSCPMGPNPIKHVVDAHARVYGIQNLRVADASIFPFTMTGHPHAVCVLIGEKVADLIKERHLKRSYTV